MLPAAVIALAATLVAGAISALGGPRVTALEWSAYDRWLRGREGAPSRPPLVVVVRDPASEARFGPDGWDRALLARVITNLARAGAGVIGVDVGLATPGVGGRGGPAADALLSEATAMASNVVYTVPPAPPVPPLAQRARGRGHILTSPDADGVVRKVPLFVSRDGAAVPAFGLALAAALRGTDADRPLVDGGATREPGVARNGPAQIPVDRHGQSLVGFSGSGFPRGTTIVPFSEVWTAIEERRLETLQRLVEDHLVLVAAEPERARHATPLGPMSDVAIQAHLARALLADDVPRQVPAAWAAIWPLALGLVAAWLTLALPWWGGLAGVGVLGCAHALGLGLALSRAGLVLPLGLPLATIVLAWAGGLASKHVAAGRRVRQLEGENARVRDALVRHESAVETLEEDLEAARVAVARSTGAERELAGAAEALRAQLAEARAQEQETRRRLADVQRELSALRPAETRVELEDAAHEALRRECASLGIVTRDPVMLALVRDLAKAARTALPVLLLGEPGTGKELLARAAHQLSPRAAHPFVAVNMAAISPELFESELFGHVKGSFTGAVADRRGYFEQADRGTIFLDEIGELRSEHQSKLLRVLQEKTFHRVGASRPTSVDVRVVSATNRNLEAAVAEGRFREDLYFRLKGLVLRLPPLRERPEDVPLLASRLFAGIAVDAGRSGLTLSEQAVAALRDYDWPGNVRELENVLRSAVALAEGPVIGATDLRLPSSPPTPHAVTEGGAEPAGDAAVLTCLREHRFDMQATARALGWDRSTVTQRLKGLGFRALVESAGDRARAAVELAGEPALARTVELKLREYHEHVVRAVAGFGSADAAVAACRRRFKNLPERHFQYLEVLVRQHFERRTPTHTA